MMLKKLSGLLSINRNLSLFILIVLIIAGIFSRFVLLDKIPVGITHDDSEVLLSAKSYWLKGTDVSGVRFPGSLFTNKTSGNISGLPSFILSPILGPFPLSLGLVHFVYVIVNIATLIFISLVSYQIMKNYKLSLAVFFVGLINPWMFAYSRYPTEAPFALLFAILGLYFSLKVKPLNMIFSSIFFVLSFYSYFGAKVAIPILYFFIISFRYFVFRDLRKNVKYYFLSGFVFLLFVAGYFFTVSNLQGTFNNRFNSESIFTNNEKLSLETNELRQSSLEFPLKGIFYNKYTLLLRSMSSNYLSWISYDNLFIAGDSSSIYRFGESGLFYILDALLVVMGIIFLSKDKMGKLLGILVISLALIAPIGNSLSSSGFSHFFRSFLLLPASILLLGAGYYYLNPAIKFLVSVLYIVFFAGFLIFYFVRYPVKAQENHFLGERVLANYLIRVDSSERVIVYTEHPRLVENIYNFYSDTQTSSGVSFEEGCGNQEQEGVLIYDVRMRCALPKGNYVVIQNQKDAGSEFYIFGDKLCIPANLERFRRSHFARDYNLERMTDTEFCNRWVFSGK